MTRPRTLLFRLSAVLLVSIGMIAQQPARPPSTQASSASPTPGLVIAQNYVVEPNIVYTAANGYEAKLDLYRPAGYPGRVPVVVHIHGGGWVAGTKEDVTLSTLPYLEMGFAVVNVEYRLARVSRAPAAVEDCLCVLHWVGRKANEYNFDLKKVVVTGASAGGHLALTTAMIPSTAGFEDQCANDDDPQGGAGAWTNPRPPVACARNSLIAFQAAVFSRRSKSPCPYHLGTDGSMMTRLRSVPI